MKNHRFGGIALILVLALAGSNAFAQRSREVHFRGTISDYTPQSPVGGPWEVRGQWSLTIKRNGKAEFSAAVNMERSDLGVINSGGGDLNNPADRKAHTHHIKLVDGTVTALSNGLEVTGPAVITFNGAWPPPFGPSSSLAIDIIGGTGPNSVTFSNIKVTFQDDAAKHFGVAPLHGVVRHVDY
jgi:hypothetical protein